MKLSPKYKLEVTTNDWKFTKASTELNSPLYVLADYGIESRNIILKTIGIDINSPDFLFVEGLYMDTLEPFHESFKTIVEDSARYKFQNKETDFYLSVFAQNFGKLSSLVYFDEKFGNMSTKEGSLEFTIDRAFELGISRILPDKEDIKKHIVSYVDNAFITKTAIRENGRLFSVKYDELTLKKLYKELFDREKSPEMDI